MYSRLGGLLLVACLCSSTSFATTHLVPDRYPTIQAGVEAAAPGDTVLVQCGTYYEFDIVMQSGVTLRGEGPPDCVVIDAQQQGRILTCEEVDSSTTIEALSFINGIGDRGGGIYVFRSSSPMIKDCRFIDNIENGNSIPSAGGGIYIYDATPLVLGCYFEGNEAASGGAISTRGDAPATVEECVFVGNHGRVRGGAVNIGAGQTPVFRRCTFVQNTGPEGSGAIYSLPDRDPPVRFEACLIAFNPAGAFSCYIHAAPVEVTCSNVYGNNGFDWDGCIRQKRGSADNFSADPLFCDLEGGDFRVSALSPCLPPNSPVGCPTPVGALGQGCSDELPAIRIEPYPTFLDASWRLETSQGVLISTGQGAGVVTGLSAGAYEVTFEPVADWSSPTPTIVTIELPAASAATARGVYHGVWRVPGDVATIGEAVRGASEPDTILVECGNYSESFLALQSGVTLESETGSADCATIDATSALVPLVNIGTGVSDLTVEGFRFENARHGALSTQGGASARFVRCDFENNGLDQVRGGAAYIKDSQIDFVECAFRNNRASKEGGAIYLVGSDVRFDTCTFSDNAVDDFDPDLVPSGGAVYGGDEVAFVGCTFIANQAKGPGGAFHGSIVSVDRCEFLDNSSRGGGGALSGSATTVTNSLFVGNVAHAEFYLGDRSYGGAIVGYFDSVTHCVFIENEADEGGAIYEGGAIHTDGLIENCTFLDNRGLVGTAIKGRSSVSHCIVARGRGGSPVEWVTSFQCNDVYGNDVENPLGLPEDMNFDEDPGFCDVSGRDLTLCGSSPCAPGNAPTGCEGLIGALAVACEECDPVAALLVRFSARRAGAAVHLVWKLSDDRVQRLQRISGLATADIPIQEGVEGEYWATDVPPGDGTGEFVYVLSVRTDSGQWTVLHEESVVLGVVTQSVLHGASPNPFRAGGHVAFALSHQTQVELAVLDLRGRHVATLVRESMDPGRHHVRWDARDDRGLPVASGVYLLRLDLGTSVLRRKLVVLRSN